MEAYAAGVERMRRRLLGSLNERDRRRYAAVEAAKLGQGGIEYLARLLGCDPKTIRQGIAELETTEELDDGRQRKKGGDANC
jgi:phage terminase small subunit